MGKLLAGVVVRDITPSKEILKMMRDDGRYNYEDIYRNLYLRILVLTDGEKRFVYFGNDLSYYQFNVDVKNAMVNELGLDLKDVYCSGTRSHNTISGWKDCPFDEMNPGHRTYGKFVLQNMVEGVKEAMTKLVPARIGGTVGTSYTNTFREQYTSVGNFEGMNHNGPRAPWLRVVRVEDLEHKTLAVLVNFSMQNCSLCWNTSSGQFKKITGDMASEVINYVECAGKHEYPVFWAVGGGADQQPVTYSLMDRIEVNEEGEFSYVHEILPLDATLQLMRLFACEQGQDILRTIEQIDNYSDEFNYFSDERYVEVPGKPHIRHGIMVYKSGEEDLHPELSDPVTFRYAMAVVNNIAFCGVNAPTYSGVYKKVMEMMPFDVTMFFDDCYGSGSCVALPELEENDLYNHASLQSWTYTARFSFNALMGTFGDMLAKYMLGVVPSYKNAPYPEK